MNLAKLALQVPTVLLPKAGIDLNRWAVIACDQYTSEPEYWQAVDQLVGDQPSTLRLVFPEVFLEDEDGDARIAAINANLKVFMVPSNF